MSAAEPYGDPDDPSFHTEHRPDHPEQSCLGCGHASDCSTHNEPALPAGPCDCGKKLASLQSIVPLKSWQHAHEPIKRIFDAAMLQTPNVPDVMDVNRFIQPLIRQMLDLQAEQRASLMVAPDGYRWVLIHEWPTIDVDATNNYPQISWRWAIRPIGKEDDQ